MCTYMNPGVPPGSFLDCFFIMNSFFLLSGWQIAWILKNAENGTGFDPHLHLIGPTFLPHSGRYRAVAKGARRNRGRVVELGPSALSNPSTAKGGYYSRAMGVAPTYPVLTYLSNY